VAAGGSGPVTRPKYGPPGPIGNTNGGTTPALVHLVVAGEASLFMKF
jgi:hypothetical protein